MVKVHRPDGTAFVINATQIVSVETTADTVVTLYGGQKVRVTEHADQVAALVTAWFSSVGTATVLPSVLPPQPHPDAPSGRDEED